MGQYDAVKQDIVTTCRGLVEKGYLMATGGNVSARIRGQAAFAITPSSYGYLKMTPFVKFIGRTVERIHLVGGGGNSNVWCQIMADVLNVEIRQVQDPIQSNARGAAWIAAVGLGEINFDDVPALVQFKRTYAPTAEHRALYDDRFAVFTQIYRQMKGIYRRLNP